MSTSDDLPLEAAAPIFHEGEREVQERCGVRERVEQIGAAIIRDAMPLQHRQFFAMQQTLFVACIDAQKRPWASVLAGPRGFVHATGPRSLRIDAAVDAADPLHAHAAVGNPVGLLGIELATRRRNRVNATLSARDEGGFSVSVDQSFGNCPQYIQARDCEDLDPARVAGPSEKLGAGLDAEAAHLIEAADTMMIASASARARGGAGADGVDVSHRGGKPGFVRLTRDAQGGALLAFPDFRGNFLFNTLGNLTVHPWAGLLFIDFDSGDLLQLTGRSEIVWDGDELAAFAGAQRLVLVRVSEALRRRGALPLRWSAPELARQLDETGSWPSPAA